MAIWSRPAFAAILVVFITHGHQHTLYPSPAKCITPGAVSAGAFCSSARSLVSGELEPFRDGRTTLALFLLTRPGRRNLVFAMCHCSKIYV